MNIYYVAGVPYSDELYHHGIKGQKWYIRRFQNEDGSLTPEGRERYLGNRKNLQKDLNAVEREYVSLDLKSTKASARLEVLKKQKEDIYKKITGDTNTDKDISDKISRKDAARLDKIGKEALNIATTQKKTLEDMRDVETRILNLMYTAFDQGWDVEATRRYSEYDDKEEAAMIPIAAVQLASLPVLLSAVKSGNLPLALATAGIDTALALPIITKEDYSLKHYGGLPVVKHNEYAIKEMEDKNSNPKLTVLYPNIDDFFMDNNID